MSNSDIEMLAGPAWKGTLTYVDYSSGKRTTIKSSLVVQPVMGRPGAWEVRIGYSDEPEKDEGEVYSLTPDGTMLRDERVVQREQQADGSIRVVTEIDDADDNAPATLRRVYTLGPRSCSIQKLVRRRGETDFIERNVYRWTRDRAGGS